MENKQIRPLSTVRAGETVKLIGVDAGQGLKSRLASMGLLSNMEFTVVSNGHPGPFVISVRNSKMVLGRGIAQKILVL